MIVKYVYILYILCIRSDRVKTQDSEIKPYFSLYLTGADQYVNCRLDALGPERIYKEEKGVDVQSTAQYPMSVEAEMAVLGGIITEKEVLYPEFKSAISRLTAQ